MAEPIIRSEPDQRPIIDGEMGRIALESMSVSLECCRAESRIRVMLRGPAPFVPVTGLIVAHVAAGLAAVFAGALAMLATKGGLRHRRAGLVYLVALTLMVLSGSALALKEWPARRDLFVIGIVTLALAVVGYAMRVSRPPRWKQYHLLAMGLSYIGMLTAFYVDNGPRLPLWWRLPHWMLWLLPSLVGFTPLVRAWRRHTVGARFDGDAE